MTASPPMFIVGSQRSGTTLIRLLLNAHSQLGIPEEGTFWMPLLRRVRRDPSRVLSGVQLSRCLRYIERNRQFLLWGIDPSGYFEQVRAAGAVRVAELMTGTYEIYARQHGKNGWGEKSSVFFRMIPLLDKLFPDARFIHMVRDGRDVFASWRQVHPSRQNASVAALEWRYKLGKARRDLQSLGPTRGLEVRYEELVAEPESVLHRVCAFLGLSFEPRMLDFWESSPRFIGAHHSDLIFKPVSSRSAGRWRRDLTPGEIRRFELVAGNELERLGYEVGDRSDRFLGWVTGVVPELAVGLPARALQVARTALDLDFSSRLGRATNAAGGGPAQSNTETTPPHSGPR